MRVSGYAMFWDEQRRAKYLREAEEEHEVVIKLPLWHGPLKGRLLHWSQLAGYHSRYPVRRRGRSRANRDEEAEGVSRG